MQQSLPAENESSSPARMTWEDVRAAAKSIFRIWLGNGELIWAEAAWEHLSTAGLTDYHTELERYRVGIRFFVVAQVYLDWCSVACEESRDDWLLDWAYSLNINSMFRLGQLFGDAEDMGYDDEDNELRHNVLQSLTADARFEVVEALKRGFGGDDDFFISLWRMNHPAPEATPAAHYDEDEYEQKEQGEDDWAVLNNVTTDKLCGYEWIVQGCPAHRF